MGGTNNRLAGARRQIADDRGFNLDFSLHDFPLGSDKPWSVPYLLSNSGVDFDSVNWNLPT